MKERPAGTDHPPSTESRKESPPAGPPLRVGLDARKLADFGIGTYLRYLIPHLAGLDPALALIAFHSPAAPPPVELEENVAWVRDGAPPYSLREQLSLHGHGRRHRLDLLHLPHYVVPWAPTCPFVATVHDTIHLRFAENLPHAGARLYARAMMRRAAARSRKIIAVSQAGKREIVEWLGVPGEKIAVVPHGCPPDARPVDDPERVRAVKARYDIGGAFLFAAANFRMRHKNLPVLLEAYRRLRAGGAPLPALAIAGSLPPGLAAAGAAAGVRFLGTLPRADLMVLFSAATLFLCPSSHEGFGLPVLEAMGCGTPVIATAVGALPEVLGDTGLLVPPGDAKALAGAAARLLADTALRRELARRGAERASRFSWEEAARRTLAVYREAVGGGTRSSATPLPATVE